MVAARSGQTSAGKASGSGRQARLTRSLFRECHGSEDDGTKAETQQIKVGRPAGSRRIDDIDGHPKTDQYGRSWHSLGRGSADPFGRHAFLRRPLFESVATKLRCPLLCKVKMSLGSF
jgi:hypothetical protein